MSTAIAALLVLSLDRGRGKATRLRVSNVEEERRIGQSMIWVSCYTDEVITGVTLVAVCPPAARMSLLTAHWQPQAAARKRWRGGVNRHLHGSFLALLWPYVLHVLHFHSENETPS